MLKSKQTRFISVTGKRTPTTRPVIRPTFVPVEISPDLLAYERGIYDADPTGGQPSSY